MATISEWHQSFKIGVDKSDSLNYPDFLPEEVDVFFNKNIEKFIAQRLYGTNPKREGIESTQKRFDDLLTLVSSSNINSFATSALMKPNSKTATLPTNYLHAIEEEAGITYLDCNGTTTSARVPVYPIMHDQYNKLIRDPFNKPDETGVLRMGLAGSMELIMGTGVTLTNYYLRYIRVPATVAYGSTYSTVAPDVNCDLPNSVHNEIIQMAVVDALGNIASNRVQVEANQLNTIE